jgi:S1-C subfamily serine protease
VDDNYIDRYKLSEDLVTRSGGVVITSLAPDSPARRQLRAGDVITRLDRTPIRSVKDFVSAERELKDKSAVLVHVIRGNRKTIEAIDLGE